MLPNDWGFMGCGWMSALAECLQAKCMEVVMNFDLRIYAAVWAVLAVVVILLALYRWIRSRGQDSMLHVRAGDAMLSQKQAGQAHTLDSIDRWGKVLTIVVVVYGVILAVFQAIEVFNRLP
jgi:hypothetical protein